MQVSLLCVGGVRGPFERAVQDYEERLSRYWRFQVEEVPAGIGKSKKVDGASVRAAEEERLLSRLEKARGEVIALTREGKDLGSRAFARLLEERRVRAVPGVTFVIGGAFGLGRGVLARANLALSLSGMTMPHELARLVLVEQLYRAGTILKNEPYHKGP
jgi:23S rRNA (pseudouridine1915-N3)-methyltransferase